MLVYLKSIISVIFACNVRLLTGARINELLLFLLLIFFGGGKQKQMANQWFKFYGGEYLSDPKIERLSPVERSCWITLMCLASMNGDGNVEYLTVEVLLNKSGVQFDPYHPEEWEKGLGVLHKFQKMKMIEIGEDTIKLTNWKKRQETALTTAERQALYRERQREQAKSNEKVTERVTKVTLEENRIEENRIEEINTSEPSSQVQQIMEIFYRINPTLNWGNKTSRKSAADLIKKFGFDGTKKMAEQAISIQGQPYAPTATTPTQLKDRLAQFKIYFDKQRNINPQILKI